MLSLEDCFTGHTKQPKTKSNSLDLSLKNGRITSVKDLDTFVDGASVKTVGTTTFNMAQQCVDNMFTVGNNHVCKTMIDVYQNDGIILGQ